MSQPGIFEPLPNYFPSCCNNTMGVAFQMPQCNISSNPYGGTTGLFGLLNCIAIQNTGITAIIRFYQPPGGMGVILSFQAMQYPSTSGGYVPWIYIGTNGYLYVGDWNGTALQIGFLLSPGWHTLVASEYYSGGTYYLFMALDSPSNTASSSSTSLPAMFGNLFGLTGTYSYNYIATGFADGAWPNTNSTWFFFNGAIDYIALYPGAVTTSQVEFLNYVSPSSGGVSYLPSGYVALFTGGSLAHGYWWDTVTGNVALIVPGTFTPTITWAPEYYVNPYYRSYTISLTAYGNANDLLAPHLYDWVFNGNNYIATPNGIVSTSAMFFSVASIAMYTGCPQSLPNLQLYCNPNTAEIYYSGASGGEWYITVFNSNNQIYDAFCTKLSDGNWYCVNSASPIPVNQYITFVGERINGSTLAVFANGLQISGFASEPAYDLYVTSGYNSSIGAYNQGAGSFFIGIIGAVMIFNTRALSTSEIATLASNYTVYGSSLAMFLDATYFSGGQYIDLSGNNNNGTPTSGIGRVFSSNRFVWRVIGLYSDGNLHIALPPNMSYTIYSVTGAVLAQGYVSAVTTLALAYAGTTIIQLTLMP